MPAEVSDNMRYVENPLLAKTGVPWHGLGESFADWMTDEEALGAIDWEVGIEPQYRLNKNGIFEVVPKSNAIVKLDEDRVLGTVGDYYVPYQNRELIELGSILVDDYGAKWDTVGGLRGDTQIFATLRLDVVSGEGRGLAELDDSEYYSWLVLGNNHTGNGSLTGMVVDVRVVCMNTYMAAAAGKKAGWSVRHTGDITSKALEAQRTIGLVTQRQKDFGEFVEKMAESRLVEEEFDELIKEVFVPASKSERAVELAEGKQTAARANWLHTATVSESIRFTRWGALNGITEYAEHQLEQKADKRTDEREKRMLSNLYGGPSQQIRDRATSVLSRGL